MCVCAYSLFRQKLRKRGERGKRLSLSLSTLRTGERLSIEWFMVASGAFGIWWQVRLPRKDPSTQGPSSLIVMCARSFQFQEGKNRRCYIHSALYTHISLLAPTKSLSLSFRTSQWRRRQRLLLCAICIRRSRLFDARPNVARIRRHVVMFLLYRHTRSRTGTFPLRRLRIRPLDPKWKKQTLTSRERDTPSPRLEIK